ncbi:OvmZ protein [Kitasatospora phosalacinea]|uniref:OvmZ protein n=1 Tax=Kitasatospora phosalacinea TaxID=2065 RepID=A0ABW6GEN0_9ACTN
MRRYSQVAAAPEVRSCVGSDCRRRPDPGALLCGPCVARLQDDLRGLRDIYVESEHRLSRGPAGLRQRVGGSRSIGIQLDDRTVELRSEITAVLTSWARLVIQERGLSSADAPGVRFLLCFLARHLDWLARHPAAADFAAEVNRLVESAGDLRAPGPVRLISLGRCPRPGCPGSLHAVIPALGPAGSSVPHRLSCDRGHEPPPHEWLRLAAGLNAETVLENTAR